MLLASSTLMASGCGAPIEPTAEQTPTLTFAIDLDPSPDVVEVALIAEAGEVEYLPGLATAVWGFKDGASPDAQVTIPGPLIRAKLGDRLIVHFHNRLDVATTIHWHGLRLPVEMDGNPMVSGVVGPGQDFDYDFVLQDAGSFWYHPHVEVDEQVELGLHGQLLVEDPDDPQVSADRVFELDDVELDADAQVQLEPSELDLMLGRIGNVLLVNGRPPASLELPAGGRERWRFVNAANGRHFMLALREQGRSQPQPLTVVAWDGGRTAAPYTVEQLLIAPGERYELLVEVPAEAGTRWLLETLAVDRGEGREDAGPFDLIDLRVGPADPAQPPALASAQAFARPIAAPAIDGQTPARSFVLGGTQDPVVGPVFSINEQTWPLNTPVEVALGATEIWVVDNSSPGWHPFHVHGLFFEVLELDGVPPPVRGLKDTVAIPGQGVARLAVRYAAPGMWMFHCTIPEHAERGMMGDLLVTAP